MFMHEMHNAVITVVVPKDYFKTSIASLGRFSLLWKMVGFERSF